MPSKPFGERAMSAAECKRGQRATDKRIVLDEGDEDWPQRVCLMVLQSAGYSDVCKEAAWEQLGRLKGWLS